MKAQKGIKSLKKTHTQFLEELNNKQPEVFNKIKILNEYNGNKNYIIFETEYGVCRIKPVELLKNGNYTIQAAINKTKYYISQVKKKRNDYDKFDYSLVDYKNAKTKVKIICKIHGIFKQNPANHLFGANCPHCALSCRGWTKTKWRNSFKLNKKSVCFTLYIIKCYNETEVFYKIGRTYNTIKYRFHSKKSMPYNYQIIKEVESNNGDYIFDLETKLLVQYKDYKYTPQKPFKGMYECFSELPNLQIARELI